jgi:hypothetical protein
MAAIIVAGGVLGAGSALAQRAITNSAAGNDDPPLSRVFDTLGHCNVLNTRGLYAGQADACAGVSPFTESLDAVRGLASAYSDTRPYDLVLANETADRLAGADGLSSGGLFRAFLGDGFTGLMFQRHEVGSYVLAVSGHYANAATAGAQPWSSYYLFDDVEINALEGIPVRIFDTGFQVHVSPLGGVEYLPTLDFTRGLVFDQISIYTLQRVPEAPSLALAGLGLTLLVAARRRRAPNN